MYDSRIGRRWNVDPVWDYDLSPYATFANNPVLFPDPNGDRIKYGNFSNWLKVTTLRLTDKNFREAFREIKSKYGMGGKKKLDLHIETSNKGTLTLKDAFIGKKGIWNGGTPGPNDFLSFNGNLKSKVVGHRTDFKGYTGFLCGGPMKRTEREFDLTAHSNENDFDRWRIARDGPFKNKVFVSHGLENDGSPNTTLKIVIDNRRDNHLMGNGLNINGNEVIGPTRTDDASDLYNPESDWVNFSITALGKVNVVEIQKKLFRGWHQIRLLPEGTIPDKIKIKTKSLILFPK